MLCQRRMALKRTVERPEALQQIGAEVAGLGEDRVVERRRVALAEQEAVPIGVLRLHRVVSELAEEEPDQQFDARERPAGMPGLGGEDSLEDAPADLEGAFFQ